MEPYNLIAEEKAALQQVATQISLAQIQVYKLNMQLEAAMKERDAAEAKFNGALTYLMMLHNIQGGMLSPDFSKITPKE